MKPHSGFLSFCLLLAALLLSSPLRAAFKIDVHINGAENPTLSFGEAGARTRAPHPPFSGMFGVADVCFADPENVDEWYDRLAEDVKTEDPDNQWILVAKSNARITWKLTDGDIPANLTIAWRDIKTSTFKFDTVRDNVTLSLRAGTTYTIRVLAAPTVDDLTANPDNNTGYARKNNDGIIVPVVFIFDPPADQPETLVIRFAFNAGTGQVRYVGEAGKPDALWEISFKAAGYADSPVYAWDIDNPDVLIITLTKTGTRTDDNWQISLTPQKTSAPPIAISETSQTLGLEDTLHAIMLRFGTLDFDGDGVITLDDATYFYNYMSAGGANNPFIGTSMLLSFTENPNAEKAANALEYFLNNLDETNFDDGNSGTLLDDATYFYNYMSAGGANNPYINAAMLMTFTESATSQDAAVALEKLKELATE